MESERNNGKYFYLMLRENFYDSDDMILLEGMENGYKYSNILLKLYLKSLKDKGKLMYKDRIPYNVEMLAKITRHDVDTVRQAMRVFQEMGIIEILDNGAIFMLDIENYIGKSSTEADRRRKYDRRIAEEKQKLLQNETECEKSCEKSHEHININLDLDTNININNIYSRASEEIINYLNDKLGTKYKSNTKSTIRLIKARLNEKFTVEDFRKVIDNKYFEWYGTDMEKFLRPETLFGTKFESYLQQKERKKTLKDISFKEIEEALKNNE